MSIFSNESLPGFLHGTLKIMFNDAVLTTGPLRGDSIFERITLTLFVLCLTYLGFGLLRTAYRCVIGYGARVLMGDAISLIPLVAAPFFLYLIGGFLFGLGVNTVLYTFFGFFINGIEIGH